MVSEKREAFQLSLTARNIDFSRAPPGLKYLVILAFVALVQIFTMLLLPNFFGALDFDSFAFEVLPVRGVGLPDCNASSLAVSSPKKPEEKWFDQTTEPDARCRDQPSLISRFMISPAMLASQPIMA